MRAHARDGVDTTTMTDCSDNDENYYVDGGCDNDDDGGEDD